MKKRVLCSCTNLLSHDKMTKKSHKSPAYNLKKAIHHGSGLDLNLVFFFISSRYN